ncbi:hypothetical protein CHCC14600_2257 [Bacillus licheniformis]|nr:hypothetical protein N399_23795 [Bacillus licheniformis CG-B52]TWL34415.1 hypothetical protein CHCC15543_3042 [Bacillus licheniformis]TWL77195.1 hypothetical protein CHCC15311_3848 [Bacillus licheniformis]TWM23849.1 hypothetical protein CHCC15087_4730 [Bacillus licheniformis]TWM77838.1 hypothetical protein CHCC14808_1764 [Bacillus licheniformis]
MCTSNRKSIVTGKDAKKFLDKALKKQRLAENRRKKRRQSKD